MSDLDVSPKAQARRLAPKIRYDSFYVLDAATKHPEGAAAISEECFKDLLRARAIAPLKTQPGARWCTITAFGRVLHKACIERRQRIAIWMGLLESDRCVLRGASGTGFVGLPDGATPDAIERCCKLDYIERCTVQLLRPTWGWGLTAEGKLIVEAAG